MTALLTDITQALAPGGTLVITYRDLTQPLTGTDRFIPVRQTNDRLLTCFLEYTNNDTVLVHDILHTRSGNTWTQQVSSYPKLQLAPQWLTEQCRNTGLDIRHDQTGPRGMRILQAIKP